MPDPLEPPAPIFASRGASSIRSFRERMTSSSPPSIGGDSTRRKTFGMASLLGRRARESPRELHSLFDEKLSLTVGVSENVDPVRARTPARRVTEPVPPAPAPANAAPKRTIFRKLTTRFNRNRSRSASPPPGHRLAAKEARQAALRARGLLPPLPLSVQEHQQDLRIAIVASPQSSSLERRPTAANRIKEEWEAKNRERLTEFRFGGNSPRQETFPLEAVTEVDSPLPSPAAQNPPTPPARPPPPALNLEGQELLPVLDTFPDPYLLPLPPSPSPASAADSSFSSLITAFATTPAADAQFTPLSPCFLPLPPSPAFSNVAETVLAAQPGSPTSPSAPPPPPPPSESELSVPSLMLDSASQTTVSTADSSSYAGRMRSAPPATRVRCSTADQQAHHAIDVIVELPGEEGAAVPTSPATDDAEHRVKKARLELQAPQRRATAPADVEKPDRRKSLNVFKSKGGGGLSPMASIRRTMGLGRSKSGVGAPAKFNVADLPPSPTLPAEFGAQQQQQQRPVVRGRTVGAGRAAHAHRLSVSPTMHSRGSILLETSKIEDEESRRMTEVAFL